MEMHDQGWGRSHGARKVHLPWGTFGSRYALRLLEGMGSEIWHEY